MYAVFQGHEKRKNPNFNEKTGKTTTFFLKHNLDSVVGVFPYKNYNKRSRNSLCSCGSGKKFKHCCLKTDRIVDIFDRIETPTNKVLK